ncbi:hypothetical protein GOP47_0003000 [Adiantum capillus-veneris]|uniref:Lipoyl-binding domain-containing protein n=1 Tax=Adiantum capillus-veneris TaxID=13818 RepID=A0A9D4ZRU5_ADICA|nr:hypothetical protein GOP47_0003000 [Adiantum capillus-veneris]
MESLCPAFLPFSVPGDVVSRVASSYRDIHLTNTRSSIFGSPSLHMQSSHTFSLNPPRPFQLHCAALASTLGTGVDEAEDISISKDNGYSLAPNSFEVQSLLMEVCDETSVAEVLLKVGEFKLHVKRDVGKLKGSALPVAMAPPVPSKPMVESAPLAVSTVVVASKSPSSSATALLSSAGPKSGSKFGLLEAAADEGLHFVTSPKVGLFRKSRVVKGKSGRPLCEEGQTVKEGQVVCYVEQLGTQQPVEAENSGEVVKILCKDGEPVGYGDPLISIRPAFAGIK